KLDAANPRIFNNHGDKLSPDSMPIPGNKLQCDSTKPYFAFDFLARVCQAYPPKNSRWQFSLTNHLPSHSKGMPSTKLFRSIDFGKPVFMIVESNPGIETNEKLGSVISFSDRLPKVGI
ncbi:MAG: hypothetical protein HGA95_05285, partial [Caldiserica bacterium]|nr:hypothetical protein [Caldisericota bacterium]